MKILVFLVVALFVQAQYTPKTTDYTPIENNNIVLENKSSELNPSKENSAQSTKVEKTNEVEEVEEIKAAASISKIDHIPFGKLLQLHVSKTGGVDYEGLLKSKPQLEKYLATLAAKIPDNSWSNNDQLAYWINAYNAFTIKLILDNYPVNSITEIKNGKPWDDPFIQLEGKAYSLNNIENDIIRKQFKEPRIHFAVNCAAKSCPPLQNDAFYPEKLDEQLEKRTLEFINSLKYNNISKNTVIISKIFEWYKSDFGNLIDYINNYSNSKVNNNAVVKFNEYDWALNK